jgi:hypothetical protein
MAVDQEGGGCRWRGPLIPIPSPAFVCVTGEGSSRKSDYGGQLQRLEYSSALRGGVAGGEICPKRLAARPASLQDTSREYLRLGGRSV